MTSPVLAELEVWHSRPITPTRRVALGHLILPVDPAPGFGGLLLGAVVAAHLPGVDEELVPDIYRLVNEVERGQRVVQPRLRHRYQVDRHGLARSTHRLTGQGEAISFQLEDNGSPLQQILGAIYATERLAPDARHVIAAVLHRALRWNGPVGPALIAHLAGSAGTGLDAVGLHRSRGVGARGARVPARHHRSLEARGADPVPGPVDGRAPGPRR